MGKALASDIRDVDVTFLRFAREWRARLPGGNKNLKLFCTPSSACEADPHSVQPPPL